MASMYDSQVTRNIVISCSMSRKVKKANRQIDYRVLLVPQVGQTLYSSFIRKPNSAIGKQISSIRKKNTQPPVLIRLNNVGGAEEPQALHRY